MNSHLYRGWLWSVDGAAYISVLGRPTYSGKIVEQGRTLLAVGAGRACLDISLSLSLRWLDKEILSQRAAKSKTCIGLCYADGLKFANGKGIVDFCPEEFRT